MMNKSILFIHGFPLDSYMWDEQYNYFSKKFNVYCPDLPGFGENNLETPKTIEGFAYYLKDYIESKGEKKVTICGFSMGGYITFAFYELFPQYVDSLILVDTKVKSDNREQKENRNLAIEGIKKEGVNYFIRVMPQRLLSGKSLQDNNIFEKVKRMILRQKGDNLINALIAMRDRKDRSYILENINVKTLFICGSEDPITPPNEMEEMSRRVKNSLFFVIEGASHLSNMEDPVKFNKIISDFLEEG